ncbi:hypothetical protein V2E67_001387 [Citrobacter freundii]|nr:hypothetical protein [Citrobacter freundii]
MQPDNIVINYLFSKDILVVISTLIAPLVAIQATRYLDRKREIRSAQQHLFLTLMATRATPTNIRHVEALNSIDVIFSGKKNESDIRLAWKAYLDFLATRRWTLENSDNWESERKNFHIDLLSKIASYLGYEFDKTHLKNQVYYPERFSNEENYAAMGKEALLKVLKGESSISVNIKENQDL